MKTHLIATALAGIIATSPAWSAHALDEYDSYRPFGAGPLTCGNFVRAIDGLDPLDKDSPKVTFTNYKRFVNGWLTAVDRFIPGLNDATGGRDADWFTGVLVNHCRANPSLTIAAALEQIIKIRFPRLFADKTPPVTHRSASTNNMFGKLPTDETINAATAESPQAAHSDTIVEYGSVPSLLVPSSSPKVRAADPVLSRAFNHAECTFYAEHYAPSNPEIANRDWKTPFINQCEAREAIASGWIIDQWPTMSYEQYALCEVPYNRKLREYGDTILAQIHMSYHGTYYIQELVRSCLETGSLMPEGYWTGEDRQMYLDSKYGPKIQ